MNKIKYIVVLLLLLSPMVALADTHVADSCSAADINTAITASADGDTVSIPACTTTLVAGVTADLVTGGNRELTIQGAGQGVTNLTNAIFTITGASGKAFRLTGMTLAGVSGINVNGQSKTWRIDDIHFDHVDGGATAGRIMWIQPSGGNATYTTGVIDNCLFTHPTDNIFHVRANSTDAGSEEWAKELGLGTSDAIYFENNTVIYETASAIGITDCEGGSFVIRYNTLWNAYVEMHHFTNGGYRGCRKWEVYNNSFLNSDPSESWGLHLRSGVGVAFNNTWQGAPTLGAIALTEYRTYQGAGSFPELCSNTSGKSCIVSAGAASCATDADCGAVVGSCQPIDATDGTPSGYPCRDQLGWYGNVTRTSAPLLFWNNKTCATYPCSPTTAVSAVAAPSTDATYNAENSTWCNHASVMPATCNSVATTYSSYACPHPLTGMAGTCKSTGTAGVTDYADNLLTVTKDGTGSGGVTSDVGSINCGATCTHYYGGQEVTLTATASPGSVFVTWADDCSGSGTGVVTVDAAHTCTATFNIAGGGTGSAGAVGLGAGGSIVSGAGGSIAF